jgi:MOSC domain-containing protein
MRHFELAALESGLDEVRRSPKDAGSIELIVRRPAMEEREVLAQADLDPVEGLVGDGWRTRGSKATADGSAHPDMQITLMNARAAELITGDRDRWPLAGDQLFVDLDLSESNLPPGTRVEAGSALLEITAEPHRGCGKFSRRFGNDAMKFVNSTDGRELNLRGIYAKVISPGTVSPGDAVRKASAS